MKFKVIRKLKDLKDETKFTKLTGTVVNTVFRKIELDKEIIVEAKPGTVFIRSDSYIPAKYYSVSDETEVVVNMSFKEMEDWMADIVVEYDV